VILNTNKLTGIAIDKLAKNQLIAIRVENFINEKHATLIAQRIIKKGYKKYSNAPSIGKIGMAFYETESKLELIEKYFNEAKNHIDDLRTRCLPYTSPIDLLRCNLDEVWPAGAMLESLYGKKMFVGLSRVVEPNIKLLAHHDIFHKDAPTSYHTKSLIAQFAANIYLTLPATGGQIQIWNREITPADFDRLRGESYGIEPELLGPPDFEIAPKIGELILFNSQKIHAVTPGTTASRLSTSCFVGYRGSHLPLTYWS
jgi:hypothetical protein